MTVRVDDVPNPLDDSALGILLGALHRTDPRREIVLRADPRLPYAKIRRVLREIQDAHFPAVGLVAERITKKRG